MLTDQLEYLIKINKERVEAYQRADHETSKSELKDIFKKMADESRKNITDLTREIMNHNQSPNCNTSATDYEIYNGWLKINPVFINDDFKFILNLCELTESAILNAYSKANANLTNTQLGELIRQQEDSLKSSLEAIMTYRDAYDWETAG